jgi:hypothetical protein
MSLSSLFLFKYVALRDCNRTRSGAVVAFIFVARFEGSTYEVQTAYQPVAGTSAGIIPEPVPYWPSSHFFPGSARTVGIVYGFINSNDNGCSFYNL